MTTQSLVHLLTRSRVARAGRATWAAASPLAKTLFLLTLVAGCLSLAALAIDIRRLQHELAQTGSVQAAPPRSVATAPTSTLAGQSAKQPQERDAVAIQIQRDLATPLHSVFQTLESNSEGRIGILSATYSASERRYALLVRAKTVEDVSTFAQRLSVSAAERKRVEIRRVRAVPGLATQEMEAELVLHD